MSETAEDLHCLVSRLNTVREEERVRLARELHDDLGQTLTGIKLDLALLIRHIDLRGDTKASKKNSALVKELTALIDGAMAAVRSISTRLRPALLDVMGFWPALESEAARFTSRTAIACGVSPSGDSWEPGGPEAAMDVFRIIQEALTNVARHSKAGAVRISCAKSAEGHILSIIDDGKGISEKEASNPRSLGIIGMRERARSFGGRISMTGSPGGGSSVSVIIPENDPAGDA